MYYVYIPHTVIKMFMTVETIVIVKLTFLKEVV